ncbi:hypothetical protein DRB96_14450 [Streptomyces sp. ICC1]|nr:hypothetical protein DRB89_14320 [Streptomyces sp. ICC4]AWZ13318.1 hypothetical protein DRB96_14450 [Streptomyces sp. ICC1]
MCLTCCHERRGAGAASAACDSSARGHRPPHRCPDRRHPRAQPLLRVRPDRLPCGSAGDLPPQRGTGAQRFRRVAVQRPPHRGRCHRDRTAARRAGRPAGHRAPGVPTRRPGHLAGAGGPDGRPATGTAADARRHRRRPVGDHRPVLVRHGRRVRAHHRGAAAPEGLPARILRGAVRCAVGISPPFDQLTAADRGLRLAGRALATLPPGTGQVAALDDRLVHAVLCADPEIAQRTVGRYLGGVLRSGSERAVLLETLRVWLDEGCSASRTAERLYCHRNTVRGRIGRIAELTGWSAESGEARLDWALALRAPGGATS